MEKDKMGKFFDELVKLAFGAAVVCGAIYVAYALGRSDGEVALAEAIRKAGGCRPAPCEVLVTIDQGANLRNLAVGEKNLASYEW